MTFSISTGQLATAPKVHESLGWGGGGGVSHIIMRGNVLKQIRHF